MNLDGVNLLYTADRNKIKAKNSKLTEQKKTFENSLEGIFFQVEKQTESTKAAPCETYNQMIKNVKNCECPYEYLADANGTIEYNGIVFQCDKEHHALCLGNMEETDNILTIPLSEGGVLKVNRKNIGELGKAIGLFSPQDVKRILQALSIDAKAHSKKYEMEKQEEEIFQNICEGEESKN